MIPTAELLTAVEGLYDTFNRYPLRADTNACPCCHKPEQERLLHTQRLRELTAEHLRMYVADAMLVWGNEDDYRHFLPRIFELMITLDDPKFELAMAPIVFNKLHFANWANWPIEEQNVVRRYFLIAWKALLRTSPDDLGLTDAADWLSGIAQAEDDLQPYLEAWRKEESNEATRHLAALIVEYPFVQDDARPPDFWVGSERAVGSSSRMVARGHGEAQAQSCRRRLSRREAGISCAGLESRLRQSGNRAPFQAAAPTAST